MRVNVFAKNLGWLFEDLKAGFARLDVPGVSVAASDVPCVDADAWVAIRTNEASAAPDPERTVACVHDLYNDPGLYGRDGLRGGVHDVRGLVLCHPEQRRLLGDAGVDVAAKMVLERPLGPLSIFTVRSGMPEKFCIGWVGRNDRRKRLEWLPEIAAALAVPPSHFRFMLLGRDLHAAADRLRCDGFECDVFDKDLYPIQAYPALYARMDCLAITSVTEAGPLTLFEALATGLPVVSTPVGWAEHFASESPAHVMVAETPAEIAAHIGDIYRRRFELFAESGTIANLVARWRLDDWFGDVIGLAREVAVRAGGARVTALY